jgi:hypothetical protein
MQRRRKVAFDKQHKKRELIPDTLVTLKDARWLEFPGKFDALWLGPYWVIETYPNTFVQLATLDGTYFPTRTNGERCKSYKVLSFLSTSGRISLLLVSFYVSLTFNTTLTTCFFHQVHFGVRNYSRLHNINVVKPNDYH